MSGTDGTKEKLDALIVKDWMAPECFIVAAEASSTIPSSAVIIDDPVSLDHSRAAEDDNDEDVFGFGNNLDHAEDIEEDFDKNVYASKAKERQGIRHIGSYKRTRTDRTSMLVNPFDTSAEQRCSTGLNVNTSDPTCGLGQPALQTEGVE